MRGKQPFALILHLGAIGRSETFGLDQF